MKDNAQLISQVILLLAGGFLTTHGIGNDDVEAAVGAVVTLIGIVLKFVHWHTTPDAPVAPAQPQPSKQ